MTGRDEQRETTKNLSNKQHDVARAAENTSDSANLNENEDFASLNPY